MLLQLILLTLFSSLSDVSDCNSAIEYCSYISIQSSPLLLLLFYFYFILITSFLPPSLPLSLSLPLQNLTLTDCLGWAVYSAVLFIICKRLLQNLQQSPTPFPGPPGSCLTVALFVCRFSFSLLRSSLLPRVLIYIYPPHFSPDPPSPFVPVPRRDLSQNIHPLETLPTRLVDSLLLYWH